MDGISLGGLNGTVGSTAGVISGSLIGLDGSMGSSGGIVVGFSGSGISDGFFAIGYLFFSFIS